MSANLTRPWGADGTDTANNKPSGAGFDYIGNQMSTIAANVVPDARGWKLQLPGGGEEILVAIGGLSVTFTCAAAVDLSGVVHKLAGQVLMVQVDANYGVDLSAANLANVWIVAISNDANVANVNLLYSASNSEPSIGRLVFISAATSFVAANTSPATKLTINTTSVFNGCGQVKPRKPTHGTINAAAVLGGTSNVVITIVT